MTYISKFFALLALVGVCEFLTTKNLSCAETAKRHDGVVSPEGEEDRVSELPERTQAAPHLQLPNRQAAWPQGSRSHEAGRKRGTLPAGFQEILRKITALKAQLLKTHRLNWEKDIVPLLRDIYESQSVNSIAASLHKCMQHPETLVQMHFDSAAHINLLHTLALANNLQFTVQDFQELLRVPKAEGLA